MKDVIFGSIISSALNFEEFTDRGREFEDCKIYFDSNLIFFVLDLYYSEFNKPAIELFKLLKKYKFELKVFSFTVDEMCKLINGYKESLYQLSSTVKVDTIYDRLKRLGWTRDDANDFIETIEDKISELGI